MARHCELVNHLNLKLWKHHSLTLAVGTTSLFTMPRTARDQSATGIYHVMIRGINRQDIFEAPEDYRKFIETLASLREVVSEDMQTKICTCHIYAYCIMPNHVHILIHEKGWTISQCVKHIADIYVIVGGTGDWGIIPMRLSH